MLKRCENYFIIKTMKKLFAILLMMPLLICCKSKEEKALALINDEMFQTLYDYDSYQPVQTTVDSAFSSIYRDSLAVKYALRISVLKEYSEKSINEARKYIDQAKIYAGSYYNQDTYQDYRDKAIKATVDAENYIDMMVLWQDSIKNINDSFTPEFVGWEAIHKFRCKSKGGDALLSKYVYVFDKDFNRIIHSENAEGELDIQIKEIITDAINK